MGIDEVIMKKIEKSGKFNYSQKEQISFGLQKGLDISIYAKPEFNKWQMEQIRFGLEKGLDVSVYAKKEFNSEQMRQIRYGLEKDIDVSIYAKPEFKAIQMYEIRLGLEKGLDVNTYTKPKFDWRQTRQISIGLGEDLDFDLKEWVEYYAKEWKFWNRVVRILSKKDGHSKDYREVTKQAILKRKIIEEDYNFYAIRVKAADGKALIKE